MRIQSLGALLISGLLLTPWISSGFTVIEPPSIQRLSHIETIVTGPLAGLYRYDYTVFNDSYQQFIGNTEIWPLIVGYEVPLDSPDVVSNIRSPATWDYRFFDNATYIGLYGANPFNSRYVLQWYDRDFFNPAPAKTIAPVGFNARFQDDEYEPSASGFGFDAILAPTDGPYANLWVDEFRNIGDPPLPGGSPVGGGSLPYTRLPDGGSSAWLLVFAAAALGMLGRKIRH